MNVLITTSSFGIQDSTVFDPLLLFDLNYKTNPFGRALSEEEALELYSITKPNGIIAGTEPITKQVINAIPELKVISRAGTGTGNVDHEAAAEKGILIFNTPEAPALAVAELTIGLILSVLRHISFSDRMLREGLWKKTMGNLLFKKTVGIAGCGHIGKATAGLLKAFGCHVIGYDPFINKTADFKIVSDKEELLHRSDIITLHMPLTSKTNNFINDEALHKMKKDSILINAARGGIVDEKALLRHLESGHLAGAALDTFEKEPYSGGPLAQLKNVVLTPHIGSYASESRIRMERESVDNLIKGFKQQGLI